MLAASGVFAESPSCAHSDRSLSRPAQVILVSSVMFTFISYWRTAAVVLCDLAGTAYYIGGIVEQSIGQAAAVVHPRRHVLQLRRPLGLPSKVALSSSAAACLPEWCARRLGPFASKIAVSVLTFDYVLTGPISGVSAGKLRHRPGNCRCSSTFAAVPFPRTPPPRGRRLGAGPDRLCRHALLFLPSEPPRHPRIEAARP